MIPSLLEQLIAARIPTTPEQIRKERKKAIFDAVCSIGNARCKAVSAMVGLSEKPVRELLAELVGDGKLITWEIKKGCTRFSLWAVKNPTPRRKR